MNKETAPTSPEFGAWSHENLAAYAKEAYVRIKELEVANAQLKTDLRYALQRARREYGNP